MGTYGISAKELLEGVQHKFIHKNKEDETGFEEFLQSFEGDVSASSIAEAWNTLAKKHHWDDFLEVKKW